MYNMMYLGGYSALISHYYTKGTYRFTNNVVFNIGFMEEYSEQYKLPHGVITKKNRPKLPYHEGYFIGKCTHGVMDIEMNSVTKPEDVILIEGNTFRNIYAQKAPILFFLTQRNEDKDIRLIMRDNLYHEIFGNESAILRAVSLSRSKGIYSTDD